jgi:RNA polymerase sigma-70 factor (ECF subfamily)
MANPSDGYRTGNGILGTTRWSLVRRAATGGESLEIWAAACWYPLYAWARRKDWEPEDAADAVQEFLGKICTRGLLAQADPARGKFRSWVLTAFGNHLSSRRSGARTLKRGGGAAHVSLDLGGLEEFYQTDMVAVTDPAQAYTRAWALTLMDEALARLADYFAAGGREALFEALLPTLEAPFADTTYEEVGARLGLSSGALRQAALRFRQRYRRLLLDVAGERLGITSEARLAEELRELLGG